MNVNILYVIDYDQLNEILARAPQNNHPYKNLYFSFEYCYLIS